MDINESLDYIFFSRMVGENGLDYYKMQQIIIDKLNKHNYAMVFDEPGAGKTIQGIYAIWDTIRKKKEGEKTNILIVAPNEQLALQWKAEIYRVLGLEFSLIGNNSKNRKGSFDPFTDNLFITYESTNYHGLGLGRLKLAEVQEKYTRLDRWIIDFIREETGLENLLEENLFNSVEAKSVWLQLNHKKIYYDCDDRCEYIFLKPKDPDYIIRLSKMKKNGLTFIKKFNRLNWDLMILDESHDYSHNFNRLLLSMPPRINDKEYAGLDFSLNHKTHKLLLLSATPIRDYRFIGDDKYEELGFKNKLSQVSIFARELLNSGDAVDIENEGFFNITDEFPYQRYFKETVLEEDSYKNREVEILEYENYKNGLEIWTDLSNKNHYFGNIFEAMNKLGDWKEQKILEVYKNPIYEEEDLKLLLEIDKKMACFIDYIEGMDEKSLVVFTNLKATREYLEKIFTYLDFEIYSIKAEESKNGERLKKIDAFNKSRRPKVFLSTWEIGNYGINLPGGNTVVAYEAPLRLNEVEQGFGRIDRLNQGYNELTLLLFKNSQDIFDSYRLNILYNNLFSTHLPNIPSKNILFTTDYLRTYIDDVFQIIEEYKNLSYLEEFALDEDLLKHLDLEDLGLIARNFIGRESLSLGELKSEYGAYLEIYKNINKFMELAGVSSREEFLKDPSLYLRELVYYFDQGGLRSFSLGQMLDQVRLYESSSTRDFERAFKTLEEADLKNIDLKNKNKLMKKMIETKLDLAQA